MPYPDQRQKETDAQYALHESRIARLAMQGEVLGRGILHFRGWATSTGSPDFGQDALATRKPANSPLPVLTPTNWQEQCAHPTPESQAETARQDEWREKRDSIRNEEDHK